MSGKGAYLPLRALQKAYLSFRARRAMPLMERRVTVDGNSVRYLESPGSGEALLFVHGLGASAERWEFVAPMFERRYRLIIPDLIGYGRSDKPVVDYTPDFFVSFVKSLLGLLGVERAHLVGSSMGGQVAALFAAENAGRVGSLVLVSPSGMMRDTTPALNRYIMAALYPGRDRAREAFAEMSASTEASPEIVDSFIERMNEPNAKMAFMSTLLGLKNSSLDGRLGGIAAPTLLVWGSKDPVIPIGHARQFVSAIPRCRFYRMESSGHTPFVDSPAKFARAVLDFLPR